MFLLLSAALHVALLCGLWLGSPSGGAGGFRLNAHSVQLFLVADVGAAADNPGGHEKKAKPDSKTPRQMRAATRGQNRLEPLAEPVAEPVAAPVASANGSTGANGGEGGVRGGQGGAGMGHGAASSAAQPGLFIEPLPLRLLRKVEPMYPPFARRLGLEAEVRAQLQVASNGRVLKARVLSIAPTESANHGFEEAALAALLQFEFADGADGDNIGTTGTRVATGITGAREVLHVVRFELVD